MRLSGLTLYTASAPCLGGESMRDAGPLRIPQDQCVAKPGPAAREHEMYKPILHATAAAALCLLTATVALSPFSEFRQAADGVTSPRIRRLVQESTNRRAVDESALLNANPL